MCVRPSKKSSAQSAIFVVSVQKKISCFINGSNLRWVCMRVKSYPSTALPLSKKQWLFPECDILIIKMLVQHIYLSEVVTIVLIIINENTSFPRYSRGLGSKNIWMWITKQLRAIRASLILIISNGLSYALNGCG